MNKRKSMASKTQICNNALSKIGVDPITSLTDNTTAAARCNQVYETVAEEVMASGAWTSTIRRATLAQTTNTPEYGYAYEYQLPTDPLCLRVLDVYESETGVWNYKIEGDKLLSDRSSIKIRYVSYIEESGSYDVDLRKAIQFRLASELAYNFTGDRTLAREMYAIYKDIKMEALAANGSQGSPDRTSSSDLEDVR